MQSVPITKNVVSSNHGEVYSIQHYVIKIVSDLRFSPGILVSSTNIIDYHDITEILLEMALNTIPINRFGHTRKLLDTYTQEGSRQREKRDGGTEH
jgi:hypothetical protein